MNETTCTFARPVYPAGPQQNLLSASEGTATPVSSQKNKEKFPKQILEYIQNFILNILSNIDNKHYLLTGQVWKALILFHSLSNQDFFIITNNLQ